MKLILQKNQKQGLTGKISYIMKVSAKLTDEENANVSKYKLSKEILYSNADSPDGKSVLGALASIAVATTINVNDLVAGKTIECKNFGEMLAIQNQVKEGAKYFKLMLDAMSTFGGDEIIEY